LQRQGNTDAIRLTWIIIKTKKKKSRREKMKNIKYKQNVTLD